MSHSSPWHGGDGSRRFEIQRARPVASGTPHPRPPGDGYRPRGAPDYLASWNPRKLFQEGMAAHARFKTTGNRVSLRQSIARFRRAVELTADDGRQLAVCSNNLGVALHDRHKLERGSGEPGPDDLDEALHHLLRACKTFPQGSPRHAMALSSLFLALEDRLALPQPLPRDLRRRLPSLRDLRGRVGRTPGVEVLVRLRAAYDSGTAAASEEGPRAGHDQLAGALRLLVRALYPAQEQALDVLAAFPGLASKAAACALAADRPARAVEHLEQGRALLWRQHLRTRSLREEVRERAPEVAEEMDRAHTALEPRLDTPTGSPRSRITPHDIRMAGLDGDDRRLARLLGRLGGAQRPESPSASRAEEDWRALTRRTALSGLTYIEPDYDRDLAPAAGEGPLVYVNVSPWRCDALIVRQDGDGPEHVPLPDLTAQDAQDRALTYLAAMTELSGEEREDTVLDVLDWLWRTVAAPVFRALDLPSPGSRMWWIPTGPLTTLPLHAAGSRGASPEDGSSVLDLAVSSYAPTLLDLVHARAVRDEPEAVPYGNRRLLLVAPHPELLPGSARIRAHLEARFGPEDRTVLSGPEATRARVRDALPKHAWTHFDCHAEQDLDDPLRSRLSLHDDPLTLTDLIELPSSQAEFAFLAACATAAGGELVHDEWISLAAALMYSEFQAVIGTLWPVYDSPTARITRNVYDRLAAEEERPLLSHVRSAHALQAALREERLRLPEHPSAWVSFVHYGV
ncbi:CHAT domain-containing protein [Streptomyces coerulescens]|uniref:CHAT domain-containing protein n=1 Tax=Streptomyces coerulescens TaxID=29304 RepID=A0ABW0CRC8_STRCD